MRKQNWLRNVFSQVWLCFGNGLSPGMGEMKIAITFKRKYGTWVFVNRPTSLPYPHGNLMFAIKRSNHCDFLPVFFCTFLPNCTYKISFISRESSKRSHLHTPWSSNLRENYSKSDSVAVCILYFSAPGRVLQTFGTITAIIAIHMEHQLKEAANLKFLFVEKALSPEWIPWN